MPAILGGRQWFDAAGVARSRSRRQPAQAGSARRSFEASAAIAGQGVAILTPEFYADDVAAGRLYPALRSHSATMAATTGWPIRKIVATFRRSGPSGTGSSTRCGAHDLAKQHSITHFRRIEAAWRVLVREQAKVIVAIAGLHRLASCGSMKIWACVTSRWSPGSSVTRYPLGVTWTLFEGIIWQSPVMVVAVATEGIVRPTRWCVVGAHARRKRNHHTARMLRMGIFSVDECAAENAVSTSSRRPAMETCNRILTFQGSQNFAAQQ